MDRRMVVRTVENLAETKWYQEWGGYVTTAQPITLAGRIVSLADIPQGTGVSERTGNKIKIETIGITTTIRLPSLRIDPDPELPDYRPVDEYILRAILFVWRDESEPVVADILNLDVGPDQNYKPISRYNRDKMCSPGKKDNKFYILADQFKNGNIKYNQAQTEIVAIERTGQVWDTNLNVLKDNIVINYIGTSMEGTNKPYLLLISNSFTGTTPPSEKVINNNWNVRILWEITYKNLM